MAEAEYLLPGRQRNPEHMLNISVNGEESILGPLPTEKPQEPPPVSLDPSHSPSPSMAPNKTENHLITKSAALQTNKSKPCRKKKKCLSDIFGHIFGESKESSNITNVVDQFPTATHALKDEPNDSPYADLDSVPILHRPKRTQISPTRNSDGTLRKELGAAKTKAKCSDQVDYSIGSCGSSSVSTNKLIPLDVKSKQGLGSCNERSSSTGKHSLDFPASSRLITGALKAEEETELRESLATSHITADDGIYVGHDDSPYVQSKKTTFPKRESPNNVSSCTSNRSPKRRARKPDKRQIRNGSLMKCLNSGAPIVSSAKIKTENFVSDICSFSPPSSLSPVDALQDVKELTFKSLVKDDSGDSELSTFRPDSNYKFSTFLMLLKDMHDTREKEGKPLTLPPSPVLIKEEPMIIPASTGANPLRGSCDGLIRGDRTAGIKTENGQPGKLPSPQNTVVKTKNRTKAVTANDNYNCEAISVDTRTGSTDKPRRKQRLPAKLKARIPGLSADLAQMAYGREFVSGHSDLANHASGLPAAVCGGYLDRTSEPAVAPKKRWQLVEAAAENVAEVVGLSAASAEVKGSDAARESPEFDLKLGAEKQTENDFSEANNTTGKTFISAAV